MSEKDRETARTVPIGNKTLAAGRNGRIRSANDSRRDARKLYTAEKHKPSRRP